MEIDEIWKSMTFYLVIFTYMTLVDVEQKELICTTHQSFSWVLFDALEIEWEQFNVAVSCQGQEPSGLGLARVMKPGDWLDPIFTDLFVQNIDISLSKRFSIITKHNSSTRPHQQMLILFRKWQTSWFPNSIDMNRLQNITVITIPHPQMIITAQSNQFPNPNGQGDSPDIGHFKFVVMIDELILDTVTNFDWKQHILLSCWEIEISSLIDSFLNETWIFILSGFPHKNQCFGLQGIYQNLIW